jgi:hypothetical protein
MHRILPHAHPSPEEIGRPVSLLAGQPGRAVKRGAWQGMPPLGVRNRFARHAGNVEAHGVPGIAGVAADIEITFAIGRLKAAGNVVVDPNHIGEFHARIGNALSRP